MQAASRPGVRKRPRVSNACIRCRQQKIKCSGARPCEQCNKRAVNCKFESNNHKILVNASYIERLQRQAARGSGAHEYDSDHRELTPPESSRADVPGQPPQVHDPSFGDNIPDEDENDENDDDGSSGLQVPTSRDSLSAGPSTTVPTNEAAEGEEGSDRSRRLHNPLLPGESPSYIIDTHGNPVFLGTSSNWSFGRRVLGMVHERVNGTSLPPASLLFEGSTYDLGWDGLRGGSDIDTSSLPTSDFALFLINAVKFHCTRLFHVFDEDIFMRQFSLFHNQPDRSKTKPPLLWFIHYLLILAFGSDLFVRAMKILPDITFLCADPLQAIEVLICIALYLQCIDMRSAAYNVIGQAVRLAAEQGMHTDMLGHHGAGKVVERCRNAWWTVYILDRRLSCLMGTSASIVDAEITAVLPSFSESARRGLALSHHVQLSKATSTILHTVYSKTAPSSKPFLNSVKDALKTVAEGSDEREAKFPVDLKPGSAGLCRLSAYLHLFHHQCLVIATRPLLFFFWQKRLESDASLHITSQGGARPLLRVCVSSAKQTMRILKALQAQGLLDSFLPFDREAGFAAATVLVLAAAVDESLLRLKSRWLHTAYEIFDEMKTRGNVIAGFHKSELQQLDANIKKMQATPRAASRKLQQKSTYAPPAAPLESPMTVVSNSVDVLNDTGDFSSEDGLLNGNQLQSVADHFNFDELDSWLATGSLEGPLYSF